VHPFSGDPLAIYLNDHLAGSTAGVELARRAASNNAGTDYGSVLSGIAREVEEDRATLEALMDRLGVGRDRIKTAAAWIAEKAGRLKPNGQLRSYAPLSRLEELELLLIGVSGKLAMWRALDHALHERLGGIELPELEARAESQRERLEALRLRAADEALVSVGDSPS
jgi:hypothetical protein